MSKCRNRKNDSLKTIKGTLDQKHTEKINQLEKSKNLLPLKKKKLLKLQNELKELVNMNPNKYTHEDIERKSFLMDTIETIKNEIHLIENCTESLNYIVKTLPILVDYYDNNELLDDGMDESFINNINDSGKKNILSYFIKETEEFKKNEESKKNEQKSCKQSRAMLYDSYLSAVDANYKKTYREKNNLCGKMGCDGEKILSQNDGYIVCKKCGLSETILLTSEKPNYKEPIQDTGTYAYKRINHLTEILSQLQAKESTDIPSKVFNFFNIRLNLKISSSFLSIFLFFSSRKIHSKTFGGISVDSFACN